MRKLCILTILLTMALLVNGCVLRQYQASRLYYPAAMKDAPYIPGIEGSLRVILRTLPSDQKSQHVFEHFEKYLPSGVVDVNTRKCDALNALMNCSFIRTDQYAEFVTASLFSEGTPIWIQASHHDEYNPFLRAFALNAEYYSTASIKEMAKKLFCGEFAYFIPQNDATILYYAMVSRYGMDWMDEFLEGVYSDYGQVLLPNIVFSEFVPRIIRRVVSQVKKAPPEEHRQLLQSVGFAYTGRMLVPTEDILALYEAFPCRTYAHELLERGHFDILGKENLWLKYRFDRVPWPRCTMISPIVISMYPFGYTHLYEGIGRQYSMPIHETNIQNGIRSPHDLCQYVLKKRGLKSDWYYDNSKCYPTFLFRINYRKRANDVASMLLHGTEYNQLCKGILDEATTIDGSLSEIMKLIAKYYETNSVIPQQNTVLSYMLRENVLPATYFCYYFAPHAAFGERWAWNMGNWGVMDETNLLSFLRFFGDLVSWNDATMQFEWKNEVHARKAIRKGAKVKDAKRNK